MWIRGFSDKVLSELEKLKLKNCNVVIDGQNYFYNMYQNSGLPYQFGCEADKYAKFLREHLEMYQKANVRCYVVFKGGHENINKAIMKKHNSKHEYESGVPQLTKIVLPVFMKTVYKEVLTELGLEYVVCQFESKQQCIALAQKLKCPIISNDIEFCFSGVPYIPLSTLKYDDLTKSIGCGIFYYEKFINKYDLTKEKLAIFIALTDSLLGFPYGTFEPLFKNLKFFKISIRYEQLLRWLSRIRPEDALKEIFRYINTEKQKKFKEEVNKLMNFICRVETPGVPAKYLLNESKLSFCENDPEWFEKGVALGNVPIVYTNLYHSATMFGSWCIEDMDADDAMLLSFDIIAYAYNLMTNFEKNEILFLNNNSEDQKKDVSLTNGHAVRTLPLQTRRCLFQDGWDRVKTMQLFEHFLKESLQGVNFTALDSLPEDAKLLILALVYFSRRKADNTTREVYSVLLSYVMLGVVFDKVSEENNNNDISKKPILDPITDKNFVTESDCNVANSTLAKYFTLSQSELYEIFDRKLLHAFVEFQHCLQQMNNLNDLCGMPYKPTVYHRTYNGTFVYKFFYSMRNVPGEDAMSYLEDKLSPAPTVLAFLDGLIKVYNEIMYR